MGGAADPEPVARARHPDRGLPARRSDAVKTLINEFQYPRLGPGQMWEVARDHVEESGGKVLLRHHVSRSPHREGRVVGGGRRTPLGRTSHRRGALHLDDADPARSCGRLDRRRRRRCARRRRGSATGTSCRRAGARSGDSVPDNWIYVHSPEVRVGPHPELQQLERGDGPEPGRTCLGMEYFCFEGDGLWTIERRGADRAGPRELGRAGPRRPGAGGATPRGPHAEGVPGLRLDYRRTWRPSGSISTGSQPDADRAATGCTSTTTRTTRCSPRCSPSENIHGRRTTYGR